jgi:hypothetical protein
MTVGKENGVAAWPMEDRYDYFTSVRRFTPIIIIIIPYS